MAKEKRAIVILGGGLKREPDGSWRTTNFDEGDNFGAMGDRLRVVAGSYLYKDNPRIIIVSGGKGQLKGISSAPTVASVIEKELIELGVSKEKIIKEEKSGSTWQQLQELKKIIYKMELDKIIIISNKWHLPRVEVMIEKDEELAEMFNNGQIELISAEEVVIKYEPEKHKEIVGSAYNSKEMKRRIALERKGVKDIKDGKYRFE